MLAVLMLSSIMLASLSSASESPWTGGYRLRFEGFSDKASLSDAEYIHLGLFTTPFHWRMFNPTLSAGFSSALSATQRSNIFEGALEFRLSSVHKHILSNVFRRNSTWTPAIGASYMIELEKKGRQSLHIYAKPFSFSFGEKTISVLGIRILFDIEDKRIGWGIQVLEISQFLF